MTPCWIVLLPSPKMAKFAKFHELVKIDTILYIMSVSSHKNVKWTPIHTAHIFLPELLVHQKLQLNIKDGSGLIGIALG